MRFSAIGDCVMAGVAVNDLRQTYPDAFVAWVVDERCAEIVNRELVSERLDLPRAAWKKRGEFRTLFAQYQWHAQLRRFGFDYGFDLQGHSKTAWCLRLAGVKQRISARATDAVARVLNPVMNPAQPATTHMVEWNRATILHLLPISAHAGDFLPGRAMARSQNLVTLCVGAGHPTKVIPRPHLESVAQGLIGQGFRVVLLGGPKDEAPNVPAAQNLIGKTTLTESVELIRESALHICGDTGTGHIAAAVGTPVVSIFGPMPAAQYRPYTERGVVLERNADPAQITPNEILTASFQLLPRVA